MDSFIEGDWDVIDSFIGDVVLRRRPFMKAWSVTEKYAPRILRTMVVWKRWNETSINVLRLTGEYMDVSCFPNLYGDEE